MPILFLALTTTSVYKYLAQHIKNGAKILLKDDRKILIPVFVVNCHAAGLHVKGQRLIGATNL